MQYEIRSIEPIQGDGDLLVEVWHWYSDAPIGNRDPDFIEHVRIFGIPPATKTLRINKLNQPVKADGTYGWNWIEVDGDWVRNLPRYEDPDYVWDETASDAAAFIEEVVKNRSREVKKENRRGVDTFLGANVPKPVNTPGHIGKKPDVLALRRKRGKVD